MVWPVLVIIGVIVIIGLLFVAYEMYSQGLIFPQVDDAHLASIEASYFYENDRLVVALILTNKDAEYTKANGHLELSVRDEFYTKYYSGEYDFTRDDFFSWKTDSGEKITGYRIDINKFFAGGSYDVYGTVSLKSGATWDKLHDSFYSLN